MRSLLILTVSAVLFAQTATRSAPEETLSIGAVELHLGMAEDVVLARIAKAGYKLGDIAGRNDEWVVAEQTDRFPFRRHPNRRTSRNRRCSRGNYCFQPCARKQRDTASQPHRLRVHDIYR